MTKRANVHQNDGHGSGIGASAATRANEAARVVGKKIVSVARICGTRKLLTWPPGLLR